MLLRAVEIALNISNSVVVATKPERVHIYSSILGPNVKIVPDDPPTSFTPLAGVNAGVRALSTRYVAVIAGDAPFVKPEVVGLLVKRAKSKDAAVPLWPNGITEPLLSVYRRGYLLKLCALLKEASRDRATDLVRGADKVSLVSINEIQSVDPELSSLRSVDTPEDLERKGLKPSGRVRSFDLEGHSPYFWRGVKNYLDGRYMEACMAFRDEAEVYRKHKVWHLERHALLDVEACQNRTKF